MAAAYDEDFPFRSHTAQQPSYPPPAIPVGMMSPPLTPHSNNLAKQPPQAQELQEHQERQQQQQQQEEELEVPIDSYQQPYLQDNKFYYYQQLQIEQEQQYQNYPYQHLHQQLNRNNSNYQNEFNPRRLPRLDTTSPSVRPRTQQSNKKMRYYAALQLNTPASASASAPPSPGGATPTTQKRSSSYSPFPFPDPDTSSTYSSSRRRPSAAPSTSAAAASTPSLPETASYPRLMERLERSPSPPRPTRSRTFFGTMSSTSRKGRKGPTRQNSMPLDSVNSNATGTGAGAGTGGKELKRSPSMFALFGRFKKKDK
ncbi:hypothetical protein AJ79_05712 [Helicocarpus griseus UAMH5409]|uniref:Uncharacterized protein n=1 Tax=Helicocarpus griseus UAMH5409 TaxID=1447875 RepID=A0A2B7XKE9_9EURO|nr:hypothetical protein AJ79_05712 [Helicocarpus griseus UAMH5409]